MYFLKTFAAIAMAQYSIASGDKSYAEKGGQAVQSNSLLQKHTGTLEPKSEKDS